jgi:hypothetical protein
MAELTPGTANPGSAFVTDTSVVSFLNASATPVPSQEEVCQRTGFKVPRGTLKTEWNGAKVRPESFEARHPLDRVRSEVREQQRGSPAPEPADTFVKTTYLDTRVQFAPAQAGGTGSGDFLALNALATPVITVPATMTSFCVAWRGRIGLRKGRILTLRADGGVGVALTRLNFSFGAAVDNPTNAIRLSLSSFFAVGALQFGIGARTNPVGPLPATPTNGTTYPKDTDWMFVGIGNGNTGQIELWAYDYAAALFHESLTGEKLAPQFWSRNSAVPSVVPTAGMTIADIQSAGVGCEGLDTFGVTAWSIANGFPETSGTFMLGQNALIAAFISATGSAFPDLTLDATRRALLGSPSGWGLGSPVLWYEGRAADWTTNRGTGGTLLYCNGDPAFSVPAGGLTDCAIDSRNPTAFTDTEA